MKDLDQKVLESSRPDIDCLEAVNFCLKALFRDRKHEIGEEVVEGLTFEELIGCLLLMRDKLEREDDPFNSPAYDI